MCDLLQIPEKLFLVIALSFGVLLLIVSPPFQVPDEDTHFFRAYQISTGHILGEKLNESVVGGILPKSLLELANDISGNVPFKQQPKQNISTIFYFLNQPLDEGNTRFIQFENTVLYTPIPYIPQILAIAAGRVINRCGLTMSALTMVYLGRWFNFLVWVFFIYHSIRLAPILKWVFFLLALAPMSLYLAASCSTDALTNALGFVLIAFVLNLSLVSKQTITKKETAALFAVSLCLTLSKQTYIPLVLLYFLIPVEKIGTKKKYFLIGATLIALCASAIIAWSFFVKSIYIPNPFLRYRISPPDQLLNILRHPLNFAVVIHQTIALNYIEYVRMFFGIFGYLETPLPSYVYITYIAVLGFVAIGDCNLEVALTDRAKVIIFVSFTLCVLVVMTLVYMTWTVVGGKIVQGIQGRYFIPFSPLLFLLCYNRKIKMTGKWVGFSLMVYSFFILRITLNVLLNRYYEMGNWTLAWVTALDITIIVFCAAALRLNTRNRARQGTGEKQLAP